MFDFQQGQVYFRGSFIHFSDANLSVASSPMLYGLAVYSVFDVTYDESTNELCIFRLKDHYKRLCDSCRVMDFSDFANSMSYAEFESVMHELLLKNAIKQSVLVRVSLFIDELMAGTKTYGLTTSMAAFVYPMKKLYTKQVIDVCVSSWQRTPDNAIPPRAKVNGSYANASLMKNEALRNGYDEAIGLDARGHVTEGTVANIYMVRDGQLITPDQSTDILEGITRDSILKIAVKLAIPIKERSVDRSELYIADELFYCGSSASISVIGSVDRRPLPTKHVISTQVADAYNKALVGSFCQDQNWVTKVKVSAA